MLMLLLAVFGNQPPTNLTAPLPVHLHGPMTPILSPTLSPNTLQVAQVEDECTHLLPLLSPSFSVCLSVPLSSMLTSSSDGT